MKTHFSPTKGGLPPYFLQVLLKGSWPEEGLFLQGAQYTLGPLLCPQVYNAHPPCEKHRHLGRHSRDGCNASRDSLERTRRDDTGPASASDESCVLRNWAVSAELTSPLHRLIVYALQLQLCPDLTCLKWDRGQLRAPQALLMGRQPPKNVHVDTKKLAPRDATGGAGPHLQILSLLVLVGCSAMSDTAQAPQSTDKGPLRGVGQAPLGEDSRCARIQE